MTQSVNTSLALFLPISLAAVALLCAKRRKIPTGHSLPPGPTPLPVIGNVLSLDSREPWNTYTEWEALYGKLVYARFFNNDVIIINSEKVAKELLEQRSHIYSDRPFIATVEPFGWSFDFAFTPYGDEWRFCRKLFHQTFRPEAGRSFRPMQLSKAHQLLNNLLESPELYVAHCETYTTSIAMSAVYDYQTLPRDDPFVEIVNRALLLGIKAMMPERAALLSAFPFLMKLPVWFPGATIKRDAVLSCKSINEMVETPYQYVQKSLASGTASPSLVSDLLEKMKHEDHNTVDKFERAIKQVSSTALAGASETTSSTLLIFILAMVLHPDVQERARAEIDVVVGPDRLPNFDDRPSLPYIDAIIRETIRWQPVAPMGVPHATSSSDVYEGHFIPKAATVILNTWAMSRDETVYPDASEFKPDRWLNSDGQLNDAQPPDFIFGFGRRICPGRHLADTSIWAAIALLLATFEFRIAKDSQGNDIPFTPTFTHGITRRPNPYPLRIVPRAAFLDSDKLVQLIHSSA
ncbi:cytochrome P450 [Leucogyrophana mollusca]|uniref:Cytochrome P450 n=1 Tax=Leucogyrophana mollusca TaxID=85980 RepID=A0ACB8C1E8_9AGAM|nr:cytochrome P450 [Leucogyrophana mollusca]